MKHVIKTQLGTVILLTAHENPPQDVDQLTRCWRNFRRDKAVIVIQLINEQYHLCCYSEIRSDLRGLGYHIKHAGNKSQRPERTFDYQNLTVNALDSEENGNLSSLRGKNALGGHT